VAPLLPFYFVQADDPETVTLEEYLFVDPSPIADLYATASLRPIAFPLRIGCLPRIADLGLNVYLFACLFAFFRCPYAEASFGPW
jgi:hypothetical protein